MFAPMRKLFLTSCLVALLALSPSLFASGVYQCTGVDGEVTFSFVPCTEPVFEQDTTAEKSEPAIPRIERLAQLDSDIASLEEELDNTKREYEDSLLKTRGMARNDLTAEFDRSSTELIVRLNELQIEREELATL